jgi:hypothetical protein
MKNLEEMIRSERDLFDAHEPDDGHINRFVKRLDELEMPKRQFWLNTTWMAVAAALVILVAGWWFLQISGYSLKQTNQNIAGLTSEFKEAQSYYQHILGERMNQLRSVNISDPKMKERLITEMDELEKSDELIMNDLRNDPGNEAIIHAIIEQYQTRLNIFNRLLKQLSPLSNHVNNKQYENPSSIF